MGTPARSNSTANVSRKRCGCPFGTFASLKSLRNRVCQLRTMLSFTSIGCPELGLYIDFGPTRRFNYLLARYPALAEFRALLEGWSARHSWSGRHFLMTPSKEKGGYEVFA
jgi:hypothetical protein